MQKGTLRAHVQLTSRMLIVFCIATVLGAPLGQCVLIAYVVKSGYMARSFSRHLLTDLRPGHKSFASPFALEDPTLMTNSCKMTHD